MGKMHGYYFDIETYSPNNTPCAKTDKIITIQFQKIDLKTGEILGPLQILKEWDEGEKAMIEFIYKWFFQRNPWQFIPIGFNLIFEFKFLSEKFQKYNLDNENMSYYIEKFPHIDLKPFAILKKGTFIGANLASISEKTESGEIICDLYENKQYQKIISYIETETKSFIETYQKIVKNIGKIL